MQLSFFPQRFKTAKSQAKQIHRPLRLECLEDRSLLSTFTVVNLQDSGAGSLRQAILSANAQGGSDTINFSVTGTIRLTTGTLPTITGQDSMDGSTAPGFTANPLVAIDFNHFGGLTFNAAAAGSLLRSLDLESAAGAGLTISGGGSMVVIGNYIGVGLDGTTVAGNSADGLDLNATSGNLIGGTTAQSRNIISGNGNNGIGVGGSSYNQIEGNYIGTDVTGTLNRGNDANGVQVTAGSGNVVGGFLGNVISGNHIDGVFLNGNAMGTSVNGNTIGLTASGMTALGNGADGVNVRNASYDTVGQTNPVTSVTYNNANSVTPAVTGWQGIRNSDTSGQYLISGTSGTNGLLFDGTSAGVGTTYLVNDPLAKNTSVYGPNNLGSGQIQLVGTFQSTTPTAVTVNGFIFHGATSDLSTAANYTTIDYPGAVYNYVHSTMGGFAVGNYDSPVAHGTFNLPLGPGHAFIYNVATSTFVTDVSFPGSLSNSVYGIWYNGGTSYTICGGYSKSAVNNFVDQSKPLGTAFLADYDSATGLFSNWASFNYPGATNYVTHFEGISSVQKGIYTLSADSAQSGSSNPVQGSWVSVQRNSDGSFGTATWANLNYTGVSSSTNVTSSNSVYGTVVVGIVIGQQSGFSYQATVNLGFQLSNTISANGGNGINLYGSHNNVVAMNFIGTDITGTASLGNAQNGVFVTAGAGGNLIGGVATGGNDPTNSVFIRPPQGNLISGNDADGVLINSNAAYNTLSGNFIGTAASGDGPLGNALDGVSIVNANFNSLLGCTQSTDPFIFYNVVAGNGGNGLTVNNSNMTTIQANFFGLGADNTTPVGNHLNGVLVEGTSNTTVMGGVIPLGNVDAANGQNGIVVQDSASGFTSFNTFDGIAAFTTQMNLGNARDGILITSTGGNNFLRTNIISRNGTDGIEIGGSATGVQVVQNFVGTNTSGSIAMGNLHSGIEVDGNASNIVIGGPQPTFSVTPHNVISANGEDGVLIGGYVRNITVNYSFIGTDVTGVLALGNGLAGVSVDAGAQGVTIGSTDPTLPTLISGNLGNGVEMRSASGNTVVGSLIGTDSTGLLPLPNGGNGVYLTNSSGNTIGRSSAGTTSAGAGLSNTIAFNSINGIYVSSGNQNAILENSIYNSVLLGIDLGPSANSSSASPVLTSIITSGAGVQVSGTLSGAASSSFTIDFFASDTGGSSGRVFLGSQVVKTNLAGTATFTFSGALPPAGDTFFTATATDATNSTSEFSTSAHA